MVWFLLGCAQLPTLGVNAHPKGVDADGDGYETSVDCDDNDASAYPGAPEQCDAKDTDCDGAVDNGACSCTTTSDGFHDFLICTSAASWSSAQAACGGWNYHLADLEDSVENAWLFTEAEAVLGGSGWWLGINDRSTEGTFAWDGGSTSSFTAWRVGEPNDYNGAEDCGKYAANGAGLWNDANCSDSLPYLCEAGCQLLDAYLDLDGDGYGDSATNQRSCTPAAGTVAIGGDCDDGDPLVHPGLYEQCGGGDEDCDGLVDDDDPQLDPGSTSQFYTDQDGDGYGDAAEYACLQPVGTVTVGNDCDDGNSSIFPGAPELRADGVDQDCDGTDSCLWYADTDGDGYGDASVPSPDCNAIAGYVGVTGDCDDSNNLIHPGVAESWYDGVDQDCDGRSDYDADLDDSDDRSHGGDDCDDANPLVHPGLQEVCDAVDQDCDGLLDQGACACPDEQWGDHTYLFCNTALNWVDAQADCAANGYTLVSLGDSTENAFVWSKAEAVNPVTGWWMGLSDRATEGTFLWDDGSPLGFVNWRSGEPNDFNQNEDCGKYADDSSGLWNDADCSVPLAYICEAGCPTVVYYPDGDGDGYGDLFQPQQSCTPLSGLVTDGSDCDDGDPSIGPGATEVCGAGDEDCDGLTDDADPSLDDSSASRWYPDFDGDGYGFGNALIACLAPEGYVALDTDCNDADPDIHPGAGEVSDGLDNDCDGYTEKEDADHDGLSQEAEDLVGSDPMDPDTDHDAVLDRTELVFLDGKPQDSDGDHLADFLDDDDDGDGVPTREEAGDYADPPVDADANGLPDYLDTPPVDTDGDGVADYLDADSDQDGVWDGIEDGDHDGDGVVDRLDTDDDNDSIPTSEESQIDVDQDGGIDFDIDQDGIPNHLDTDTDGDGCGDAAEGVVDQNEDGIADYADGVCGKEPTPCGCQQGEGSLGWGLVGLMALLHRRRKDLDSVLTR